MKILVFDDKSEIISTLDDLKMFGNDVHKALKSEGFTKENLTATVKYGWEKKKNNETQPIILKIDPNPELIHKEWKESWYTDLGDNEDIFIFCDYAWGKKDEPLSVDCIYEKAKDKEKITFIFYSTIMNDDAQEKVYELLPEQHACHLMKEVMTCCCEVEDFSQRARDMIKNEWK